MQTSELEVEVAGLDETAADILSVAVPEGSRLNGVYVGELRLPQAAAVSLMIRGERRFVPTADTRIIFGDRLLIVCASDDRTTVERRLDLISRHGRLAAWRRDERESSG